MPQLSEWLELMLAEIARKQDDERRGHEEELRRERESAKGSARPSAGR
jgi:hypothetical protein